LLYASLIGLDYPVTATKVIIFKMFMCLKSKLKETRVVGRI